jgi:pheromone a factor receptor
MTLFCIIVVLPLIMVLLFRNIVQGAPWNLPYDFYALHFGPDPFNIYFISFTTSDMMDFPSLAINFIAELAGIAVFIPFGTTPEALNMYRKLLLAFGLGYIFPKLREEYVPKPKRGSSLWSSFTRSLRGKGLLASMYDPPHVRVFPLSVLTEPRRRSTTSTRKDSLLPTTEQISLASRPDRARSPSVTHPRDMPMDTELEPIQYPGMTAAGSSVSHHNPWPDLPATEIDAATAQIRDGPPPRARNPFPFPFPTLVSITKPPVRFPSLSIPFHSRSTNKDGQLLRGINDVSTASLSGNQTHTPTRLTPSASTTTTATTITPPKPMTTTHPSPWAVPAPGSSSRVVVGVDTRVWAASEGPQYQDPGSSSSSMSPPSAKHQSPSGSGVDYHTGSTTSRGVMVETSIAQRSMDLDIESSQGGADGREMPTKLRVNRASSAAS